MQCNSSHILYTSFLHNQYLIEGIEKRYCVLDFRICASRSLISNSPFEDRPTKNVPNVRTKATPVLVNSGFAMKVKV